MPVPHERHSHGTVNPIGVTIGGDDLKRQPKTGVQGVVRTEKGLSTADRITCLDLQNGKSRKVNMGLHTVAECH